MNINPYYSLQTLDGAAYLLPFGQGVASMRRGMRLNDAAVLLWELMQTVPDRDSLAAAYLDRARIGPDDAAEALSDLDAFLRELEAVGILRPERGAADDAPLFGYLRVGPLTVELRGEAVFFSRGFDGYITRDDGGAPPDQSITVTQTMPPSFAGAVCVLENSELCVWRDEDRWYMLFPDMARIRLVVLSPDGSRARFHVVRGASGGGVADEALREELFHAARHAFLLMARRKGYFAMHAASILYRDAIWLFSAPSGTGKSTQAALWHDVCGTPVINGDLALLRVREDGADFFAMPWCGTSGLCENIRAPLGGVVLLRKGKENVIAEPPLHARQLAVNNRLISPVWTEEQLRGSLAFAAGLCRRVPVYRYACTKDRDAVAVLKAKLDSLAGGRAS